MPTDHQLPNLEIESRLEGDGYRMVAGVDEVGRGAWAGPVVAAAVILSKNTPSELLNQLDDSKKLTPSQRESIATQLEIHCVAIGVGQCASWQIDMLNIVRATQMAMMQAIDSLKPVADYLLIDALRLPECSLPQQSIIRGDSTSSSIAAASIIAKVYRDRLMQNEVNEKYPQYGFKSHKGYGTREHRSKLNVHGNSDEHRKSFHPMSVLANSQK